MLSSLNCSITIYVADAIAAITSGTRYALATGFGAGFESWKHAQTGLKNANVDKRPDPGFVARPKSRSYSCTQAHFDAYPY